MPMPNLNASKLTDFISWFVSSCEGGGGGGAAYHARIFPSGDTKSFKFFLVSFCLSHHKNYRYHFPRALIETGVPFDSQSSSFRTGFYTGWRTQSITTPTGAGIN